MLMSAALVIQVGILLSSVTRAAFIPNFLIRYDATIRIRSTGNSCRSRRSPLFDFDQSPPTSLFTNTTNTNTNNNDNSSNNGASTWSVLHRRRLRRRKYIAHIQKQDWVHSFFQNTAVAAATDSIISPSQPTKRTSKRNTIHSFPLSPTMMENVPFRNDPLTADKPNTTTQTVRKNTTANPRRKNYSLYATQASTTKHNISSSQDLLDTVGNWMTHVAVHDTTSSSQNDTRFWKDRLEEQLDYALGIHEQGKHYQRWKQHDNNPIQSQGQGQGQGLEIFTLKPKTWKRQSLWEEDGNIMAVLLGKSKHYYPMTWNISRNKVNFKVHTMTSVFYLSFKIFFVFLSNVCRWASCRGTLPQPIVVFSLIASLFSAPRKKRTLFVGLMLIGIRTFAEMVHAYKYGREDWDDEEDVTSRKRIHMNMNEWRNNNNNNNNNNNTVDRL